MLVRATITVDIETADHNTLSVQRARLAELVAAIPAELGQARLEIRERRPRTKPRAAPPPPLAPGFEVVRVRYAG